MLGNERGCPRLVPLRHGRPGPVGRAAAWAEGPSGGTAHRAQREGVRASGFPPAAHTLHQATRVLGLGGTAGAPQRGEGVQWPSPRSFCEELGERK